MPNTELEIYFKRIDDLLALKNHEKLTDKEKEILKGNWAKAYLIWRTSPKATDSEFALNKQLEIALANVTYDVLHKTRNYV